MPFRIERHAVRAAVAERHHLEAAVGHQVFDVAEPFGEPVLLIGGEVLAGKDQHAVIVKGLLDCRPGGVIQRTEANTGDNCAKRGIRGFYAERHRGFLRF